MELKPCPWQMPDEVAHEIGVYELHQCDYSPKEYTVSCNDCFIEGPVGLSEEEAIYNWNRRAEPVVSKMESAGREGMTIEGVENLLQELLRLGASAFCGCKQGCHYHDKESTIQYAEKYHELFEAIKQYKGSSEPTE